MDVLIIVAGKPMQRSLWYDIRHAFDMRWSAVDTAAALNMPLLRVRAIFAEERKENGS